MSDEAQEVDVQDEEVVEPTEDGEMGIGEAPAAEGDDEVTETEDGVEEEGEEVE